MNPFGFIARAFRRAVRAEVDRYLASRPLERRGLPSAEEVESIRARVTRDLAARGVPVVSVGQPQPLDADVIPFPTRPDHSDPPPSVA